MKLSELLAAYGDEDIAWQNLDSSLDSINVKKGQTKITFGTDAQMDIPNGRMKELCMIVWLDRDKVKEIIAQEKAEQVAHAG